MGTKKDLSEAGKKLNEDAQASLVSAQYEILPLLALSKDDRHWLTILRRVFRKIQKARRTLKKQRVE